MDPSPQLANFEDYKQFVKIRNENQEFLKKRMKEVINTSDYNNSDARKDITTFQDKVSEVKDAVNNVTSKYFSRYPVEARSLGDEKLLYKMGDAWQAFSQSDFPEAYFTLIKKIAVVRCDLGRYQNEVNGILSDVGKFQKQVAEFFRIYKIGSLHPAGLTGVLWNWGIEKLDNYILSFRKDYFEKVVRILEEEGNDTSPKIRSRLGKLLQKINPAFYLDPYGIGFTLMSEKLIQQLYSRGPFADCLDRMVKERRERSEQIVDEFKGRTPEKVMKKAREALRNDQGKWGILVDYAQDLDKLAEDATTAFLNVCKEYDKLTEELRKNWLADKIWEPHFRPETNKYLFETYLKDLQEAVKEAEDKLNEKTKMVTTEIIQEIHGYIKEKREMSG